MIEVLGYQTVLSLHLVAFFVNITLVIVSDSLALLWVLGKQSVLGTWYMHWLHRLIWIGLAVSIVTGAALFTTASAYLLETPAFWVKVGLVGALVINSFFISCHLQTALTMPFRQVPLRDKQKMFLSGAISTGAWVGVVIAATQLGL